MASEAAVCEFALKYVKLMCVDLDATDQLYTRGFGMVVDRYPV